MENILVPSKVEFIAGSDPNTGTVVITPCFHGYGTTLGNCLRRVLLSSLPGAAVEAFKIKGVQHEFSAVDGVKEDVVEIMLNLKQLALKVHTDEPVILNLIKKGAGEVTGKDIVANANVEVANPNLVIAHATSSKTLEMEIIVGRGRGFKPAEEKDRQNYGLGTIVIDSIYTPIKDVGYRVEYTRVGNITNFEKLSLNIETNGTISPQRALEEATEILMNHFEIVLQGARAAVFEENSLPALSSENLADKQEEMAEKIGKKSKTKTEKKESKDSKIKKGKKK